MTLPAIKVVSVRMSLAAPSETVFVIAERKG
jgi:hypothetical protein